MRALYNSYLRYESGLFFSSEAPGVAFSAPFSPSGRLYEPEATSHFKKVHPLHAQRQKWSGCAKLSSCVTIIYSKNYRT